MEPISQPLSEADERYSIIVVGSGYGGGVAASRLARAGQHVCVLERGREILPGKYPVNPEELLAETQVSSDTDRIGKPNALFDFRVGKDMAVLVGCGLGGTSLINANVALEADPRILADTGWPKAVREGEHALAQRHYDMAKTMLGSKPYPNDYPKLRKLAALEASAKNLGKSFCRPPINVTFKDGENAAGVQQSACVLCGDCVTGCNYGAKNTTLMNYLPDAAKHGAHIFTGAKVLWVERAGDLWKVCVEDAVDGSPAGGRDVLVCGILAETVILAAGTLGSTEILLRSREKGLTTSRWLGRGFSGNGDTLGFAYNCAVDETNPDRAPIYGIGAGHVWPNKPDSEATRPGPCITGIIDMRDERDVKDGMVIEDGVLPSGLSLAYPPMFLFASALSAGQPRFVDEGARLKDAQFLADGVQRGMEDPAPFIYGGPVSRAQTFLVMSHEATAAGGELLLEGDRLKITFPGVGDLPVFARNDRVLQKASEAVRGNYVSNPLWSRSADRQLISVHPLGGCQMGETGETGVVNDRCRVFSGAGLDTHEGLYVCDGSVIRGSLGVNPLLTISAISERAMELLAEEKRWTINYDQAKASPEKRAAPRAEVPASPRSTLPALASRTDWPASKAADDAPRAKKSMLSKVGRALRALGPLISAILARNWGLALDIFNENICDISPGMRFSEQMRGPFSVKVQAGEEEGRHRISNPFELAARRGAADGDIMEAEFHVRVASLHELINRPEHAAELTGRITLPTLAADSMKVSEGRLQLLIDDPTNVETWLMVYSGLVESGRRGALRFEGRKTLRGRTGTHWWTDVTTLFVTLRDVPENKVVGRGILKLGLQDFIKQAQLTRVSYASDTLSAETGSWCRRTILCVLGRIPKALAALQLLSASKLASFFAERIVRAHGGILPYLQNYPAIANAKRKQDTGGDPQSKRALIRPRRYEIETKDHKTLALTRYEGGSKGPLIVAPGIGVTAASYAMSTVDVNFVEYFTKKNYDVWLFDYRASPALPTSKERFTVDDIVENDWPAAVKFVCEKAHTKDVQVLGHCVGSLSLLMALLNGLEGVRSAVCSQFSLHPVTHWFNYAKIDMNVVGLLEGGLAKYLGTNLPMRRESVDGVINALGKLLPGGLPRNLVEGFPYVDMRSYGTQDDQALDALLWDVPMPPEDHCKNPVCHRMFMVYGLALNHEHINEATHNALEDIFGPISSHLFNQLKVIMDIGRAVDKDGKDRYLPHADRLKMPIMLLSGSRNRILMPESTQRTLEWMCEANPENASKYSRHVFPAYAHMDLFIGKNADRDIFPFIEKTLDAHPRVSAKPDDATAVRVR